MYYARLTDPRLTDPITALETDPLLGFNNPPRCSVYRAAVEFFDKPGMGAKVVKPLEIAAWSLLCRGAATATRLHSKRRNTLESLVKPLTSGRKRQVPRTTTGILKIRRSRLNASTVQAR